MYLLIGIKDEKEREKNSNFAGRAFNIDDP